MIAGYLVTAFLEQPPRRMFLERAVAKFLASQFPTPTRHRTEAKTSEADQAEGGGFGDDGHR